MISTKNSQNLVRNNWYGCGSVYKRFHVCFIRDSRVHGAGVTLPLHGRYKAVTLRSCNVDPCIRTRISRGFQNCAQIDLNQHARKTIRQKPQIALPSTCRVPPNFMEFKRSLEMSQSLIHGPAPVIGVFELDQDAQQREESSHLGKARVCMVLC